MRATIARRLGRLVTGVTISALAFTGCAGTSGAPNTSGATAGGSTSAGTSGGPKELLTLGVTADIEGWDPGVQPGYQGWAAEAVWDRLVYCDSTGGIEPAMLEDWEINDDRTAITGQLREGMEFTDGGAVDAASIEAAVKHMETTPQAPDYAGVVVTAESDSITLTWPEPQPIIANKACNLIISSPEQLESGEFTDQPVGSGPYVLDVGNTTRGSQYAFTKNPDHWNAAHYPFERLVVKVIESETAAVSALKTGQIDASLIPSNAVKEAETSNLDVLNFQGQTTRLIISDRTGKVEPALGDKRVRQAMNMVFDKEAMVQALYLGNAEPTAQVFRKGSDAYIEGLEDPYPFDVEKAKQLMSEAGYADGFELELPTMEGQNHETLMPYVTQQLAEINITVKQVPLSGANAISDLLSGKFPVVLWQLGNLGDSTYQIYVEATPEGWWDLQHEPDQFVGTRWDKLQTASDEEARTLEQEINRYLVDEAWFAPMVYMGTSFAFHSDKLSIPTQSDPEALTPKLRDFQ